MPDYELSLEDYMTIYFAQIDDNPELDDKAKRELKQRIWLLVDDVKWGRGLKEALPYYTNFASDWISLSNARRSAIRNEAEDAIRGGGTEIVPDKLLEYNGIYYDPQRLTKVAPDAVGKILSDYYEVNAGKMTPAEQATYDLALRRYEEDKRQFDITQTRQTQEFATTESRLQSQFQRQLEAQGGETTREANVAILRAQQEAEWSSWRAGREAELAQGGPVNWISQWYLQRATPPWAAKRYEPWEAKSDLLARAQNMQKQIEPLTPGQEVSAEAGFGLPAGAQTKLDAVINFLRGYEAVGKEIAASSERWDKGKSQEQIWEEAASARQPTAPAIPPWLTKYAPELYGKQELAKANVKTPSYEQWMATPWSEKEGLRGYMQYTGQPYPDLEEEIRRVETQRQKKVWESLPQPYRSSRWIPA